MLFDWVLLHLCRIADTIHFSMLFLVRPIMLPIYVHNEVLYETTQALMEKLAVEALQVSMVKTVARIVEEAKKIEPVAVVMGTRGRSLLQREVGEYCFHNCKTAPVIVVPSREAGEESVI
ncbi:hypothetical protein MKX03_016863 [Papaver bracteatum]|nr:hypothetical protein MKX03_016863 [Papaver bracteatum]